MEYEAFYRLAMFAGILMAMGVLELWLPKRDLRLKRQQRWLTNLSFAGVNSVLVRLMALSSVPLVAMSVAAFAGQYEVGLFAWVGLPFWLELIAALLLLDFAIYVQHWASHKFSLLWRIHQVHHTDLDIDVTTAVRFHPIEIGLSMLYKVVLVLVFGIDPLAVLLFEILLNGCALFNHSNVALPLWLDRLLRLVLVTPDMHRVHHSIKRDETDSNYGFNLAIWDRLFGTYIDQPEAGHEAMKIGLPAYYETEAPSRFRWSLWLPFRGASE